MPEVASVSPAEMDPFHRRISALAENLADYHPVGDNQVRLLDLYQPSLDALITDINAARNHVHLLYYIFDNDAVGKSVVDALRAAQQRGVKCRLVLDAVGSSRALHHLAPELRAAGIEVIAALPVNLLRRSSGRIDLRNHRKIAVIDGQIAHVGSQNIVAPKFVPGYPNEELVARATGPIVAHLQSVYLADRYFETDQVIDETDLLPHHRHRPHGNSILQILPSGPGHGRENALAAHGRSSSTTRENASLITHRPTSSPTSPFLQVYVRVADPAASRKCIWSVPEHCNQPVTRLAQQSYFETLLDAGVQIHLYQPHFLHAKHLSVDDEVALIGSSNIDIRSFALNAEISLIVYDPTAIAALRAIQDRYFKDSRLLTKEEWSKRSVTRRTIQNLARLADALL